ncbi:MAG: hypothetical protein NC335_01425 [Bacteroides sp.]|nr:hypothetical protein [Bacteroides sp.]
MRQLIYMLFVQFCVVVCSAFTTPDKAESLKSAYRDNDTVKFWNSFPDTFSEFIELYGYNQVSDKPGVLYNDSDKHIEYLFHSCLVSDMVHFEKLYGIAKDGYWDADAANYFHNEMWKLALKYPNLWTELFESKKDEELLSFWKYVISSPHPESYNHSYFNSDIDTMKCFAAYSDRTVKILHMAYLELLETNSNILSTTGPHEIGHTLGMEHKETGIMSQRQDEMRTYDVPQENIDEMVKSSYGIDDWLSCFLAKMMNLNF